MGLSVCFQVGGIALPDALTQHIPVTSIPLSAEVILASCLTFFSEINLGGT